MDFQELLNVANYNKNEAKYESSIKRYSTVLPPPKKPDRSSVQSENIRRYLAKKKAEEDAKVAEARKQRDKLLELRSQSTKNNKKAKIMASRTKDNDFSKIKLSEDEILSKKKIEMELQHKHLIDKKERMKARIELEEKEKLLPRKRKRKSKHGDVVDDNHEHCEEEIEEDRTSSKNKDKNGIRKPPRAAPPLSFTELLKVAETKMHEPVVIPKKKEEERLMTKKERKLAEEERERLRRKQERIDRGIEPSISHKNNSNKQLDERTITKNPHVIHIDKNKHLSNEPPKFKIPKNSTNVNGNVGKHKTSGSGESKMKPSIKTQSVQVKQSKVGSARDTLPVKSKESATLPKKPSFLDTSTQKNLKGKIRPPTVIPPPRPPQIHKIDTDALTADIERKVREKLEKQYAENLEKQIAADIEKKLQAKLEKEMAEKYRVTLEEQRKKLNLEEYVPENVKRPIESKKVPTPVNGKITPKSGTNKLLPKKNVEKSIGAKKDSISQKGAIPKPPPKKPFHKNPYLDPPRRILEPLIPQKRRPVHILEDDDDDEYDDMSDFIDDDPSVGNENVSQYISEIFGYDRSKYSDEDDDDIMETSYSEQMKEEMKSARLGYLEDLEEEKKQRREEMERKKKKMKLKK